MGQRDPRRVALEERIRSDLVMSGALAVDVDQATAIVYAAVREQVRAGLLKRHSQGYCVDHHNRGAQRQAVYVLAGCARGLIGGRQRQPRAV